jgi:hypothetical protein
MDVHAVAHPLPRSPAGRVNEAPHEVLDKYPGLKPAA